MDPLFLEALATLETANGRKTIKGPQGEDSNNLYNIKDFTGKGYRAHDKAEGSNDAYRVYASRAAATDDLLGLLSRKYPAALEARSPQEFATALKAGGYATDPKYIDKFVSVHASLVGRGASSEFERPAPAAPAPAPVDRSLQALYAAAQGPRPPKQFAMTRTASAAADIAPLPRAAAGSDDWFTKVSADERDAVTAETAARNQSVMDIARAQFMQTTGGEVLRRLARPSFEPDGSAVTEKELEGYSTEEQDAIRQGTSKAERDHLRFEIDDRKAQQKEAAKSGLGWAIAGAVVAGLPESWAAGAGAGYTLAKLGMGARALASAGKPVAAAGSLAAENIGVGLGMTAVQDYLTPDVHVQDYVIGAIGDGLGMALNAPAVLRASKDAETAALKDILDRAIDGKKADIEQARANLGEEATHEQVGREASRIQAERLQAEVRAHASTLPADRRLIPDDVNDELMGDAPAPKGGEGNLDAYGWDKIDTGPPVAKHATEDPAHFSKTPLADRTRFFERDPSALMEAGEGMTIQAMRRLPEGVTLSPKVQADVSLRPAAKAVQDLVRQLLPGKRVVLAVADDAALSARATKQLGRKVEANGVMYSTTEGHIIGMTSAKRTPTEALTTAVHEVGHVIWHEHFPDIPKGLLSRMVAEHGEFIKELRAGKATARLKRFAVGSNNAVDESGALRGRLPDDAYAASFDEYSAEAFVRWVQRRARDGGQELVLDKGVVSLLKSAWERIKKLWELATAKGYVPKDEAFDEFFDRVLKGTLRDADMLPTGEAQYLDAGLVADFDLAAPGVAAPQARTDADIARDYGLDTLALGSAAQKARYKAMVHLYRRAEAYPMPDEARMSKLLSSSAMSWAAPTALALLKSKNPVARMVAAELLESGGGAGGRRSTAAIAKYVYERQYMGNAVNDLQRHYVAWRNAQGGSLAEDTFGGKKWEEFNHRVAAELEERAAGRSTGNTAPAIEAAADVLEAAYERMRVSQKQLKTPGWASLPETSYGYMPHRMSAGKVRAMTPDQGRVLHGVLREQFEQIEGFDAKFSDGLAAKYIDIVRKRGTAGYSAPVGVHSAEAADIVEQAAQAMGLSADEAAALAKRVQKAAPAHTRHRLQLDLNREYQADGQSFRLLDLFETDQLSLLRSQAGRVSGEAALVRHGIMGSTGMKLLRDALSFGAAGGKADNATLEAFDQVAAEFLGTPFGKTNGKWMDRALQFNSLVSLGGIGFNQAAEVLNGAMTLGARHAIAAVGSVRRLRAEILALAKGQKVNNPIIGSLETYGAEFGADHYKLVFPFDSPHRPEVYGTDTISAADRLLRGGTHLQGKLSLWRAITSAQERGFAEQIVHKALRMIREGGSDVNLADMGIDANLAQAIRAELPSVAKFDARGRLVEFDITKLENREAADSFVQAVHRGTRQIIQGSFIGETGKWAHHDVLRLMTQFRTFSLTAIDKQWNRQVGNHGTAKALGMLLGTMTLALPIVMTRAYVSSIGRPDQEEYLEKRLSMERLGRETLNYVALSGLAGDLFDVLSATAGYEPTGGRTGANKTFVGNAVAPAIGTVNDLWQSLQNTKDGTDVYGFMKHMPFARLPWLLPAINALKPE